MCRFSALTLLLLLFFYSEISFAKKLFSGTEKCGDFEILGEVVEEQGKFLISVNRRSQSEIQLSVPFAHQLRLASYLGKSVTVVGTLAKPIKSFRGEFVPTSIRARVPDPLGPERDFGFREIKITKCVN